MSRSSRCKTYPTHAKSSLEVEYVAGWHHLLDLGRQNDDWKPKAEVDDEEYGAYNASNELAVHLRPVDQAKLDFARFDQAEIGQLAG